jgi:hypothetical protein
MGGLPGAPRRQPPRRVRPTAADRSDDPRMFPAAAWPQHVLEEQRPPRTEGVARRPRWTIRRGPTGRSPSDQMAPRKREPRGRLRPTSLGRREPPLPVMSRTLGAGGAWVLPGEPPSDRIGCARPRRSPPHRSPGLYSRLDHLLSRRTHRAGPRSRHPEPAADCWPEARPVPPGSTTGIGASGGSVDPGRFGLILRPRAPACPTFSGVRGVLPWKAPCVLRHGILGAGTGLPEDDLGSGLTDHRVVFRGKARPRRRNPRG